MSINATSVAFTKANVDASPDKHGVYELRKNNGSIYFGRASGDGVTIRSRLQAHQAGREGACTQSAEFFRVEVCNNPITREKELIDDYKRTHGGKLPACNEVSP